MNKEEEALLSHIYQLEAVIDQHQRTLSKEEKALEALRAKPVKCREWFLAFFDCDNSNWGWHVSEKKEAFHNPTRVIEPLPYEVIGRVIDENKPANEKPAHCNIRAALKQLGMIADE